VSRSAFCYRLTSQRRAFIYIRSPLCVSKQAGWHIIRPVQFTLWWSNFSSLKHSRFSHRDQPPILRVRALMLCNLSWSIHGNKTWDDRRQQRALELLLQPNKNKTNQYRHAKLSYYRNRVNYIRSFIWARNSWVQSKSTMLSLFTHVHVVSHGKVDIVFLTFS